jgi:hypothetical protein
MIENIKQSTFFTLEQLKIAITELDNAHYQMRLPILSNSSVGMHTRHILEFYQCLLFGVVKTESINYDKRLRNLVIETDSVFAVEIIDAIIFALNAIDEDKAVQVMFTANASDVEFPTSSSISRELCYLMEHSIHHMAIIKMAYFQNFKHASLPENFGVAFSTIKHNKNVHSNLLANK